MFRLKLGSLFHWFYLKWIWYLISYLIQCTYRWTSEQPISSTNSYFSCKYFETMASKKNEYNNTSLKVLMSSICLNNKIERTATAFHGKPQMRFLKLCGRLMRLQTCLIILQLNSSIDHGCKCGCRTVIKRSAVALL